MRPSEPPYLLLVRRQAAPLVAQHPGDLRERHVGPLRPKLLATVIHEAHVARQGGLGCIVVLHRLLPLPSFCPGRTSLLLCGTRQATP